MVEACVRPDAGVLVIEDDEVQRAVLHKMVRHLGLPCRTASNLEEARAVLAVDRIRTVLLDLKLDREAGLDVLTALGSTAEARSLIFTSGCDERTRTAAARLARAKGVHVAGSLSKPVRPDRLAALLRVAPEPTREPHALHAQAVGVEDLHTALQAGHIRPEFQPKICLASWRTVGVEALARWHSPTLGRVSPDSFIPLAEATGQIEALTEAILSRALGACARWRKRHPGVSVAVNIAPSLVNETLYERVVHLLEENGVPAASLVLEITESQAPGDVIAASDWLTRLRIFGVQLSIDDFGTGYSSLVSLLSIPFNEMKLDRMFVANAARDPDAERILRGLIAMSREMGLTCVAEGIESTGVRDKLIAMGCVSGQGWLWSPALAEEALNVWLDDEQKQSPV